MSNNASKGLEIDAKFTALELIGSRDAYPDNPLRRPDLLVHGGMRVKQTSCFEGDLTLIKRDLAVEGNTTVVGSLYLANVYADAVTADMMCIQTLKADVTLINSGNVVNLTTNEANITNLNVTTGNIEHLDVTSITSTGNVIELNTSGATTPNVGPIAGNAAVIPGDPASWLGIKVNGVDYLLPLWLGSAV
jgi:hypothetical protein